MEREIDAIFFDPKNKQEHISRQIQAIMPVRTVIGETSRGIIAEDIQNGKYCGAKIDDMVVMKNAKEGYTKKFLDHGIKGTLQSDEAKQIVAATMDRFRYGAENVVMHDFASGLWTAVTNPNPKTQDSFYDVHTTVNSLTGRPENLVVVLSREAIYKLALGPLVTETGYSIRGAGDVVNHQKDRLSMFLDGKLPEPMLIASIRSTQNGEKVVVRSKPIIIHSVASSVRKDLFEIYLDPTLFPVIEQDGKYKVGSEGYLHTVAGLSSILMYARQILSRQGVQGLPQAPEAHKAILLLQSAFELSPYFTEIAKPNPNTHRIDIAGRRYPVVKSLYPSAIQTIKGEENKPPRIRYKDFSRFMSSSGLLLLAGLEELGITDQLDYRTMLPAIERGAEFPDQPGYENVVFLKAENLKQLHLEKKTLLSETSNHKGAAGEFISTPFDSGENPSSIWVNKFQWNKPLKNIKANDKTKLSEATNKE